MGRVATRVWESRTQTAGFLGSSGLNSVKIIRQRGPTEEEGTSGHGRVLPAYSDASWGCTVLRMEDVLWRTRV